MNIDNGLDLTQAVIGFFFLLVIVGGFILAVVIAVNCFLSTKKIELAPDTYFNPVRGLPLNQKREKRKKIFFDNFFFYPLYPRPHNLWKQREVDAVLTNLALAIAKAHEEHQRLLLLKAEQKFEDAYSIAEEFLFTMRKDYTAYLTQPEHPTEVTNIH